MTDFLILNQYNISPFELHVFLLVKVHPWVNFESLLQKCLVGRLVQANRSTGAVLNKKTTTFIGKLFAKRGADQCGM